MSTQSDVWNVLTAVGTDVAALATIASAVVIAIQAVLTRQSLVLTRQSLDQSAEALRLAREENVQERNAVDEATKARIDAAMPALAVSATLIAAPEDVAGQPFQPDEQAWTLDRNGQSPIAIRFSLNIGNDSDRRASVRILNATQPHLSSEYVIARARGDQNIDVPFTTTVSALHQAQEASQAMVVARVTYDFPGDTGATDEFTVHFRARYLHQDDSSGEWNFRPAHEADVHVSVAPFSRTYWRSRARGETY